MTHDEQVLVVLVVLEEPLEVLQRSLWGKRFG